MKIILNTKEIETILFNELVKELPNSMKEKTDAYISRFEYVDDVVVGYCLEVEIDNLQ